MRKRFENLQKCVKDPLSRNGITTITELKRLKNNYKHIRGIGEAKIKIINEFLK